MFSIVRSFLKFDVVSQVNKTADPFDGTFLLCLFFGAL